MLTRSGEALPIEAINSITRLSSALQQLLSAVIEYNRAEIRLFVALGTSPVEMDSGMVDAPVILPAPGNP